ncbi:MAG: hypothetical protein AAF627_14680 [Myxococcota bacterium]
MELTPQRIQTHLRFDVERLRASAQRLFEVEAHLLRLRDHLEHRAQGLRVQAMDAGAAELGGSASRTQIWYAQAQAAAELAKTATMQGILRPNGRLALVAAMALNRWVAALQSLSEGPVSETVIFRHVQAGRLAHRTLRTLKPQSGMRRYCGVLTSSLVVSEFVHPGNAGHVAQEMKRGIERAKLDRRRSDEVILEAVSAALRTGARLAESTAEKAEPKARELAARAERVESDVEARLRGPGRVD